MRSKKEKGRVTKRLFFDRMRFNKKIDLSRKKRQMKYTEAIQKCLKEREIEKEDPRLRDWQQALAQVKDARRKQGQRFTLTSMLLLALAAILSNHVSELAIAQWGAGQSEEVKVEHETGIVLTQGHVERGETEPQSKPTDKQTKS